MKTDPLLNKAESLVKAAHIGAGGMFTALLDHSPFLRKVDIEHGVFILTVAGVFIAASRLNNLSLSDDRIDGIMEVVSEHLNQWDPDGIQAFEDCKGLFESEFDRLTQAGHDEPSFVASDSLGIWIVLNVLERRPQTDKELKLIRVAGAMVTTAFFAWWGKEL